MVSPNEPSKPTFVSSNGIKAKEFQTDTEEVRKLKWKKKRQSIGSGLPVLNKSFTTEDENSKERSKSKHMKGKRSELHSIDQVGGRKKVTLKTIYDQPSVAILKGYKTQADNISANNQSDKTLNAPSFPNRKLRLKSAKTRSEAT